MRNRGDEILDAALQLAVEGGLRHVTREGVAHAAGVSNALVSKYWGTIEALRDKLVMEGVRRELLPIVAQAILDKHPHAVHASNSLRERAARHLLHG